MQFLHIKNIPTAKLTHSTYYRKTIPLKTAITTYASFPTYILPCVSGVSRRGRRGAKSHVQNHLTGVLPTPSPLSYKKLTV